MIKILSLGLLATIVCLALQVVASVLAVHYFAHIRKATRGACAGYLPRILNTDAYADAREHRPGRILGADLHLAGLQRCRRGIGSVPDRKKHLAIISVTVHLMLWRLAPVHRSDPILCVHGRLAARARLGGFLQCSQGDLLRPVWVAKIFRFRRRANQSLPACAIPFRKRGVGHRHERWDGMRWTRQCRARLFSRGGFRERLCSAQDERR